MDLILIYGPPATGKYTISQELVNRLKYKFLHNHAIIDLAMSSLDKTKSNFWSFCWKLRIEIIKEAIHENIKGLIMTLSFTGNENEIKSMTKIVKTVEKSGGSVKLIKLNCDIKELKKRVVNESRRKFGKIQDIEGLEKWFQQYKDIDILPNKDVFILNTTKLSPKESTQKMIEFLKR